MNSILINGIACEYVPAIDRGLQYGDGIFETIACTGDAPVFLDQHLQRMAAGADRLAIPFPDRQLWLDDINWLLRGAGGRSVIKLILTRGPGKRGYRCDDGHIPTRLCMQSEWPHHVDRWQQQGVSTRFCCTPASVNPVLGGIKTLNRLENVLAANELNGAIDEGFMLDPDGNVVEGTMSNIFAVVEDVLVTPDLSRCGIRGIMRDQVIDIAHENNIDVQTRNIGRDELLAASELLVCNSVIGLCTVRQLEHKVFAAEKMTRTIKPELHRRMQADAEAAT